LREFEIIKRNKAAFEAKIGLFFFQFVNLSQNWSSGSGFGFFYLLYFYYYYLNGLNCSFGILSLIFRRASIYMNKCVINMLGIEIDCAKKYWK
jgi:hypothetical protein